MDKPDHTAQPKAAPMGLPGGYRRGHNPVLMIDPQGNTVDWSNGDHVRAFVTALARDLARLGVSR